ncbi:PIN domain-containing protein [Cyanobacterium aponinum]|uniref:Nucleotide-binding protein, PIN domain-containing protein n=1 Tax=Cyanobacterium aponinum (strain PCC 10605) TaxID=755178 RepID=K9Z905_CYAAP|nr:PIN domain-containing protein [Cyanobacterium aponinum]AFZ55085.1 Nucleotide-binding protein, PIN domain-containing protein [Cyanobacterium aponinum PCC 10605]
MFLVVDANILIGELLRKRGQEIILNPMLTLYVSERVFSEANYELDKRVNFMIQQKRLTQNEGKKRLGDAKLIVESLNMVIFSDYQHLENHAKNLIPRDLNDWETVAISILLDVDIWTKDSDFIGCGRATWTTDTLIYLINANLLTI